MYVVMLLFSLLTKWPTLEFFKFNMSWFYVILMFVYMYHPHYLKKERKTPQASWAGVIKMLIIVCGFNPVNR